MSERVDVAILGTGPAGLSAAITLKIRNKKILLLGSKELSGKVVKAHEINNYLGIPAVKGEELAKHFADHLRQMEIEITEDMITNVYAMGEYFSLQSKSNQIYEADAVIISTGVNFGKPYPGEEQFLGRGVSYCATCDAPLYKGKRVALIGSSPKEEAEARFMSEVAAEVYYVPLYKDEVQLGDAVKVVKDIPVSIEGKMKADKLILKEQELEVDGIFILRESVSPAQLVPGLAMEENHIAVNRKMETNLKGCFACGDIVGAPYQYIKAAGEGNVAALSAVSFLDQKKRSEVK
ncbi:MAG: NAD(P)/FAD-dependent oxidoreductase [Lachnospiraceae bacterium]|nr:NAD(P)/FAD-dependent oxidoreductase [Lachnospiraceae bacterium]